MRFGLPAVTVVALGSLALMGVGCGSNSPATGGTPHSDGGGGSDGRADRPAGDAPETGIGGAAGSATGDGAAGAGTIGDAAPDSRTDGSTDISTDMAGDASDAATDARGDGAASDGAGASTSDGSGEPVSMPCTAAGACDPFDPTSCGPKVCAVGLDGNTACVAGAASPKGLGAACATRTECAGGLDCVTIGTDPAPTCQRMCPRGSIGFCGGEYRCTNFIVGCIQYCRLRDAPCDIYAQDCAGAGMACTLSVDGETGARYTGCRPAGTAARGDRCDQGATCGKGLVCVREGGVSTCRQVCTGDGGGVPCLAAGETCSGVTSTYQISFCH